MIRMFLLAAVAASATAAFASETMTLNVPFNFEAHGKAFPAGKYAVEFDSTGNFLMLFSKTDTKKSFMWGAAPADYNPDMARVAVKFDSEADGTHALRSIRFGSWETPVLDVREAHAAQREVSIAGGR
ncbi:MAG TPA: hypothetical protein VMA71_03150 [Alloacidobacterium sp.]|nr:hypothetical protein [Alloacidobacterium sp.]